MGYGGERDLDWAISFNFHVALKVLYKYLWHINEIFATRVEIGQCLLMKESSICF